MVLLVPDRTGSPALAGTVVGALALPVLVTGPLLGAWLDRTTRRRAVLVANQVLMLGVLLALLALTGTAPSYVVVLLSLLAGITAPVLTGGFTGLVPPLVPAPHLRRAYGAEATSYNVAGVVGPALAGALAAFSPPRTPPSARPPPCRPSPWSPCCACRCHRPPARRPPASFGWSGAACGCSPPCRRCAR